VITSYTTTDSLNERGFLKILNSTENLGKSLRQGDFLRVYLVLAANQQNRILILRKREESLKYGGDKGCGLIRKCMLDMLLD